MGQCVHIGLNKSVMVLLYYDHVKLEKATKRVPYTYGYNGFSYADLWLVTVSN